MTATTQDSRALIHQVASGQDAFSADPFAGVPESSRESVEIMLKRMGADLAEAAASHVNPQAVVGIPVVPTGGPENEVLDPLLVQLANSGTQTYAPQPVHLQHLQLPEMPVPVQPAYSVVYSTSVGDIKTEYTSVELQGKLLVLVGSGQGDKFSPRAGTGEPGSELRLCVTGPGWTNVRVLAYHLGISFTLRGEAVMVLIVADFEEPIMEKRGVVSDEYSPASAVRSTGCGVSAAPEEIKPEETKDAVSTPVVRPFAGAQ